MRKNIYFATFFILFASMRLIPTCSSDQLGRVNTQGKELGRGVQGAVFPLTNTEVVKVLEMPPEDPAVAEAEREIKIMSALKDYPLTVRFNDSCERPSPKSKSFYIFMERCEAELFDYLDSVEASPKKFYEITIHLLRIFMDINQIGVFHIDNQPRNVMQCGGQLKLIDFGKGFINTQPTNKRQKGIEIMNMAGLFRTIRDQLGVAAPELDNLFGKMKEQGLIARKNGDLTLTLADIMNDLKAKLASASSNPIDPSKRAKRAGDFIVADQNTSYFAKFNSFTKMILSPLKKLKDHGHAFFNERIKGKTTNESVEDKAFEFSEKARETILELEKIESFDEAAWSAIENKMALKHSEAESIDHESLKI